MTDLDEVLEWLQKSQGAGHGLAVSDGGLSIVIIADDGETRVSRIRKIGGIPLPEEEDA